MTANPVRIAALGLALAAATSSSPVGAQATRPLGYQGTINFGVVLIPPISITATGTAFVSPGLSLSQLALPGGTLATASSGPLTTPLPIFQGFVLTAANGSAAFSTSAGKLGGPMALSGLVELCLLGLPSGGSCGGSSAAFPLTSNSSRGLGLGSTPFTASNPNFSIQVRGGGWTTGVTSVSSYVDQGFVHGPASGGLGTVAQVGGAIRLVSPATFTVNPASLPLPLPGILTFDVLFVPEPTVGWSCAVGVGALLWLGRRRARRR